MPKCIEVTEVHLDKLRTGRQPFAARYPGYDAGEGSPVPDPEVAPGLS